MSPCTSVTSVVKSFHCDLELHAGGITGQLRIKVGNIVAACCDRYPGGSTADTLFYKRLSLTSRFERCGPPVRPAAGGE
jgi:hypothetical protein